MDKKQVLLAKLMRDGSVQVETELDAKNLVKAAWNLRDLHSTAANKNGVWIVKL